MKKILSNIFLFLFLNISAQEKTDSINLAEQKKYFEIGEKALKKSNKLKALNAFHSVCFLKNLDATILNTYEITARRRVDSLLPFFQKKEAKKWIGKWKLKQLTTEKYNYEYLEITDTEILFFEKNSNSPVRIEQIKFAPYDDTELMASYSQLLFKNNEIWEFDNEKVKNEKRLITKVIQDADGIRYILLDERGIIKDPKKRKEALAKEIRTYYILEK